MNKTLRMVESQMLYRVKPYPWVSTLEFTTRCNSNCSYCIRNKSSIPMADITVETLNKILVQLKQTKVEKVILGGWGEPTLHSNFDMLVDLIKSQLPTVKLKIFTNGILLSEKVTSLLKFDEITISLNHNDSETYSKYNRVNQYRNVAENIESFLKLKGNKKPEVSIQLLKTLEANELVFTNQWLPLLNKNDHLIFQPLESTVSIPTEFYPCYDARTLLMITLTGDAYCCCRSWIAGKNSDVYLGNVVMDGLQDIIASVKHRKVLQTQVNGKQSKLNPCSQCDIWVKNKNHYKMFNNKWRLA